MNDGIIALLILFTPVIFYIIYWHKDSTNRIYKKNFFDWVIYVLAWIAVPFFIVSSFALTHWRYHYSFRCENWEERRRLNLYMLLLLCVVGGIFFLLFYVLKLLKSLGYISDEPNEVGVYFFIFFVCSFTALSLCGLYKLTEKYEKNLKVKSYIPGYDTPVNPAKKQKKEKS